MYQLRQKWSIPDDLKNIHRNGQTIFYTLGKFFSQFNEIESIRVIDDYLSTIGFGFAFIQFKNGTNAEAIILMSEEFGTLIFPERDDVLQDRIRISSNYSAANSKLTSRRRPPLSSPPDPESPSNILNALNDHCLQLIFRYLSPDELCSVVDVCQKFKANAESTFSMNFSNSIVDVLGAFQFERLLRKFGNKIKYLGVYDTYYYFEKHSIFLLLIKYFSDKKCQLTKLDSIFEENISQQWINMLKPIFKRLTHLKLSGCVVHNYLDFCENLIELKLDKCETWQPSWILVEKFRGLKKLSICYCNGFFDFFDKIQPNAMLNCLELKTTSLIEVDVIASKFPNLKEIDFHTDRQTVFSKTSLCPWKTLKKVGISDAKQAQNFVNHLIEANSPVEWLKLRYDHIDDYRLLAKMNQLQTLEIFQDNLEWPRKPMEMDTILNIIKYATKLNVLIIDMPNSSFTIDNVGLDQLLTVIRKRNNSNKLIIKIKTRNNCSCDVSNLNLCRDILKIQKLIKF